MKKVIYLFVGLLTLMFVASCDNEDPVVVEPAAELVDVSFDLNLPDLASKDDNKDPDRIPTCVDLDPSYVIATIEGVDYTLKLVTLNDKMETEVIKLAPGQYDLEGFVVYNNNGTSADKTDDIPVYASPVNGSFYQNKFGLDGVSKSFDVLKFEKKQITIDVLCYQPYDYEDFGFVWFKYAKYQVKTICFFGDICTKYFEEFHMEGSPYFGQSYDGYDFAAIFEVVVKDAQGNTVSSPDSESNAEWFGTGSPLCVEFPDLVGVDESFTAEIWLAMPSGEYKLVHTVPFTDANWSGAEGDNNFGGDDGIYDFVVGNCSYDSNNANFELPAYVPSPSGTIRFKVTQDSSEEGYVQAIFDMDGGDAAITKYGDLEDDKEIAMWCAEKDETIYLDIWYQADVYSSLQLGTTLPVSAQSIPWGKLNWIMNNKDGFTTTQVQNALWWIIHNGGSGAQVAGLTDAADAAFVPTVGDWAILIVDADGYDGRTAVQLMIVRVDP